jgi:hypothetical protein
MKTHIHKIAICNALILSSTPLFSVDVLADAEKKQSSGASSSSTDKSSSAFSLTLTS